jgi:hypothetical protein
MLAKITDNGVFKLSPISVDAYPVRFPGTLVDDSLDTPVSETCADFFC